MSCRTSPIVVCKPLIWTLQAVDLSAQFTTQPLGCIFDVLADFSMRVATFLRDIVNAASHVVAQVFEVIAYLLYWVCNERDEGKDGKHHTG